MAYKVTWTPRNGEVQTQSFNDEGDARQEAHKRCTDLSQQHGKCVAQIFDEDQILADLTYTHYA